MLMSLVQYLKDVKTELSHVSWPTQKQTIVFTALVVVISIITSIYLGIFDFIFMNILKKIIG